MSSRTETLTIFILLLVWALCIPTTVEARPVDMSGAEWAAEKREQAREPVAVVYSHEPVVEDAVIIEAEESASTEAASSYSEEQLVKLDAIGMRLAMEGPDGCNVLAWTSGDYANVVNPGCFDWAVVTMPHGPNDICYGKITDFFSNPVAAFYWTSEPRTEMGDWSLCEHI